MANEVADRRWARVRKEERGNEGGGGGWGEKTKKREKREKREKRRRRLDDKIAMFIPFYMLNPSSL